MVQRKIIVQGRDIFTDLISSTHFYCMEKSGVAGLRNKRNEMFFVYFCFVRLPLAMRGGKEEMYEGTKRWPRMELGGRSFLGTLSKSLRVVLRLDPCWGLVKGRENCS